MLKNGNFDSFKANRMDAFFHFLFWVFGMWRKIEIQLAVCAVFCSRLTKLSIFADDPAQKQGNHIEQREKLGLTPPAPKGRSNMRTPPPEPTNALQKVEVCVYNIVSTRSLDVFSLRSRK